MTEQRQQVMVIGGGAIGLSIAWNLARRGLHVRLVERDRVGRGTSRAGAGILPPANFAKATDPIDRLRGLSHEMFPQWTCDLQSVTGIDCGLRRCGGWYLADTAGERAAMLGMADYWDQLGITCEPVRRGDLARREPCLSDWASRNNEASAYWVPDEFQLRSPWYLRALQQACRISGVVIEEGIEVTDVKDNGQFVEVAVGDSYQSADIVILCSGVWISRMSASLRLDVSVIPIRGQILLLKTAEPISNRVINIGHRYLVCREDGHILVGSCEEEVGFDTSTTDSMLRALRDFAISVIPSLETAQRISGWSGLRPMTFDGFPMIGPLPGHNNVYVAGGHFRSGLHLSPATAAVITDLVLGQQPALNLEAFRVGKQQTKSPSLSRQS